MLASGCKRDQQKSAATQSAPADRSVSSPLKHFVVKIDWVPTPEYYGFFYAQDSGIYKEAGLEVEIQNGTGAANVAKELAVGSIYAGTTTSDNVLREMHKGGHFSRGVALLKFNPCVIVSRAEAPIRQPGDLAKKTLGTNQQSSVYQQLKHLIHQGKIADGSFTEFPIGWGGSAQLKAGQVDAFLAYTTNGAVDVELDGGSPVELFFSDYGISTIGVALIIAGDDVLAKAEMDSVTIDKFIKATQAGYARGAEDVRGTIKAMKSAVPTIDERKVEVTVRKIKSLNASRAFALADLDKWIVGDDVTEESRQRMLTLFK